VSLARVSVGGLVKSSTSAASGHRETRLVEEMRRFAEAAGFVAHRSLVLDFGVGKGQDPIRALLLSLLGLTPSSEADSRHRAAERLVGEGAVAPERLVFSS
jgi:hypothetical protein